MEMELPEMLRTARRTVEDFGDISVIHDLAWMPIEAVWTLCVDAKRLTSSDFIPETSRWWFCVSPRYPWGSVTVYPDKDRGIKGTFHHQLTNDHGEVGVPWRTGDICLRVPAFALRRRGFDEDPMGQPNRLRWYFERLLSWIDAAAADTLSKDGDPMELPHIVESTGVFGFSETPSELAAWTSQQSTFGLAEFLILTSEPAKVAVKRFQTLDGESIREVSWGEFLTANGQAAAGFWIRLPSVPSIPPYKAPATWGELRQSALSQGICLDNALRTVASKLRNGKEAFGMVGFPVPQFVGGPLQQFHWLALKIKPFSHGEKFAKGFRKSEDAYWRRDKAELFGDNQKITWLSSQNWAELGTRGQLPQNVKGLSTTILGAGAVGGVVAELLVRGGVRDLLVVDRELLSVGNLVRHTLSMADVDLPKAIRLARRLNTVSPHVKAIGAMGSFPELAPNYLSQFDRSSLVVDCTGSDDLLASLAQRESENLRWYWSISVSLGARRVYAFSAYGLRFPLETYFSNVAPWIAKDRAENLSAPMRMEGTGCWHPVFPATADEMTLMVSAALKQVIAAIGSNSTEPKLSVFERNSLGKDFLGVSVVQNVDQ